MYDVVPSTLWPNIDTPLALRVGECGELSHLREADLVDEASRWGLGSRAALAVLRRVRDAVPVAARSAAEDVVTGGGEDEVVEQVQRIIAGQNGQLSED